MAASPRLCCQGVIIIAFYSKVGQLKNIEVKIKILTL